MTSNSFTAQAGSHFPLPFLEYALSWVEGDLVITELTFLLPLFLPGLELFSNGTFALVMPLACPRSDEVV